MKCLCHFTKGQEYTADLSSLGKEIILRLREIATGKEPYLIKAQAIHLAEQTRKAWQSNNNSVNLRLCVVHSWSVLKATVCLSLLSREGEKNNKLCAIAACEFFALLQERQRKLWDQLILCLRLNILLLWSWQKLSCGLGSIDPTLSSRIHEEYPEFNK